MEVIVYLLTSNPDSPRVQRVQALFNHQLFFPQVVVVADPLKSPIHPGLTPEQSLEYYRVRWCLQNAMTEYPENPIIILKDTTVSNSSSETLAERISIALASGGWEVCYLCKWQDRCDLYSNKRPIDDSTSLLVNTSNPHGFQSILFTPTGRDKFHEACLNPTLPIDQTLTKLVQSEAIVASTIVPNLMQYDLTAITANERYNRLSECQTPNFGSNCGSSSSWIWWILIAIIVIIALLYVAKK